MTGIPTRILLVEDNPGDAILLEEMLVCAKGGPFELTRAARMSEAVDRLAGSAFDAILLDLTLPDSRGFETLQRIQDTARHIPIIILTGVEDEKLAIGAIRHGAQDYLVKGTVDGRAIARAIRYAIDRQKTEDALRQSDAAYASAKVSVDTVNVMAEGVALISMDGFVSSVNPALVRLTGHSKTQLEGRNVADLLPSIIDPDDLVSARAALDAAMRGEIPEMGEATLISNPAGPIPIIPQIAFITDHSGKPTTVVLTIQDITAHKRAERQSQIVTAILALFAKKTSRKEYLNAVTRVIRQWSGCHCVGIRVLNDKGDVPYESHVGFSEQFIRSEGSLNIERDDCACTRVISRQPCSQDVPYLTNGGSFWCGNTLSLQSTLTGSDREKYRGVCAANGFTSVSIIPIRYHNTMIGALHFAEEKERRISRETVEFAESTLAPIIGEAIYRFNVESELRSLALRLTLAEERARRGLAVALHDTVGQSLALGKIKMGTLGQMLTGKEPQKILTEIREMFETAVQQTRTLSFELSPPILYELGLGAALEWLGEDFSKRHGFRVRLTGTSNESPIDESISILFFQSARELLTNITKHAGATEVEISLDHEQGRLAMKIIDDGKGMDLKTLEKNIGRKNSLGLFSIRERMKQIGGSFTLKSAPGKGTSAVLTAPLQESKGVDSCMDM